MTDLDAVVVGSGPNGLAAAITLAEAGKSVRVYEGAETIGGGMRSAELTAPGFVNDVCSTVHTALLASPFFQQQALGLTMCQPEVAFAHPLDGGRAAAVFADVARSAETMGPDGKAWRGLFGPLVQHGPTLWPDVLGPLRRPPRHPVRMARFGLLGLRSVQALAQARFEGDLARAAFAGVGAHAMRRLNVPFTSAYALALGVMAQQLGWPVVAGGSQQIADALADRLRALGGEIVTGTPITSLSELPPARVRLLDVAPTRLPDLAGGGLPLWYRTALRRYRYGPGVFKLDYALSAPMPWTNELCRRAGTVHVGGTLAEIARSEADAEAGRDSPAPFVLAVQATVADPSRAPAGQHTLWAYSHVPNGSVADHSAAIERQLDRFAPGFRDLVIARSARTAADYDAYNPNYVGGDINAGRPSLWATLVGPVPKWSRYRVPLPGTYLCSSATAPGGGVHGMCGYNAAHEALRHELR